LPVPPRSPKQTPLEQSELFAHVEPGGFFDEMHVGALQRKPDAQSPSTAHDVPHTAPAHRYGEQATFVPALHVPLPSHVRSEICWPPTHVAAMHSVPAM
jgi:hypothetical protein